MPKPLGLADIRLASSKAVFGVTFLKVGIVPGDGGTWILTGANTYTGTTTVGSGFLGIGGATTGTLGTALSTSTLILSNGGIFALSGGLIGDTVNISNYRQGFEGTPVFLGCSDIDPHIPLDRVEETARVLKMIGARVRKEIYPNLPHTINQEEIDAVNDILAKAV